MVELLPMMFQKMLATRREYYAQGSNGVTDNLF